MRNTVLLLAMAVAASVAVAQQVREIEIPPSSVEKAEDIGVRMHTNYFMYKPDPAISPSAPPPGVTVETPGSIACIYGLVAAVAGCPVATATTDPTGGSKTIVIVDAYDDPSALADLKTFSTQFGLPAPSFTKIYASGTKPPNACTNGWEVEEALDVQWAHAMAPNAKIVLMEAASNSDTDLFAAVQAAAAYITVTSASGEVSMSWGGTEFSGETVYDIFMIQPGVVFFASSGDSPGPSYPSTSPQVVSAGGTQIVRNSAGDYTKQVATTTCGTGCGGGLSTVEPRPTFQNPVKSVVGSWRGTPDIASNASSKSPVYVYDSSCKHSWLQVWGTSVASPTLAGIINRAGGFKADTSLELTEVYDNRTNTADYTDITSGSCGGASATTGYDFCTGVGVVKGYGKK